MLIEQGLPYCNLTFPWRKTAVLSLNRMSRKFNQGQKAAVSVGEAIVLQATNNFTLEVNELEKSDLYGES